MGGSLQMGLTVACLLILTMAAGVAAQAGSAAGRNSNNPSRLYVWAGSRNGISNDFLAVFGLDPSSAQYGKLLCTVPVNTAGNEAHHMALSKDGTTLIAGGLLSALKAQDDVFFFDLSKDATCPSFAGSFDAPSVAIADAFVPLSDGGFVGTMMGAANGGTPGGIVRFSGKTPGSFRGTYPQDSAGTFVGAEGLNPHGIDVREDLDMMVSTDYIDPASSLVNGPTGGRIIGRTTLRVWKLSTMQLVRTIQVTKLTDRLDASQGGFAGFMDIKFVPGHPTGVAFANGGGVIYAVDPNRGTAEPTFVFDSPTVGPCIQAISGDGSRLYGSLNNANKIYMYDATNPFSLVVLDILTLPAGAGPHFLQLVEGAAASGADRLVVSNYFLQEPPGVGVVYSPANYKVQVIKIDRKAGKMSLDPRFDVDFSNLGGGIGPANPHGMAFA